MALRFLYVGRLAPEKGIISLIHALQEVLALYKDVSIDIFGDGVLKNKILQLQDQFPNQVIYHGRQDKSTIIDTRQKADYFVMPSQFLETFGLTACESLLLGVPVIGNKKGGLQTFISDELNIQAYKGGSDAEKLINLLIQLIKNPHPTGGSLNFNKQYYSPENRFHRLQPYLNTTSHMTLISDYINYNGGGVETHIHDANTILQQYKISTTLYGHKNHRQLSKLRTRCLMIGSICNIRDTLHINTILKQHPSQTIRRHSISRVIGRLPLYMSKSKKQMITYHELGLFHPYPSKITDINQIPQARSLRSFLDAGNPKYPRSYILLIGKYILITLIHRQLNKKITTHIVPSKRMIAIVKARHPNSQVVCIPHFVTIE